MIFQIELWGSIFRTIPDRPEILMRSGNHPRGSGNRRVRAARVQVQDESSGVVWETPGWVAAAGPADKVLRFDHIAEEVVRAATPQRAAKSQVCSFSAVPVSTRKA